MSPLLDWGIEVILWCQRFSPALDIPFRVLTWTGEAAFYILLLPILYWFVDRSTAIRLTLLFLISAYLNAVAKAILGQPRPFTYDPRVLILTSATGGGLPSGHAQNAVVLWGYLALRWRKRAFSVLAVALIVLVSFSRIYLGVHFPTDILGGWLVGILLLAAFCRYQERLVALWGRLPLGIQIAGGFLLPAVFLALYSEPTGDALIAAAALAGMASTLPLERRWGHFRRSRSGWPIALSFLLGLTGIAILYIGPKSLLGDAASLAGLRFLRYGARGAWVILGAPWAMARLGLALLDAPFHAGDNKSSRNAHSSFKESR